MQELIQKFTNLSEKAIVIDPANTTNRVIIFLFIKNLYKKDIRRQVAGAKTINTLADAFRLAYHNLLKLKKYERLVYNEEQTIAEINKITDSTWNMKVNNGPKTSYRDLQYKKTPKNYTFQSNCWKCGIFGHSAKEFQNNSTMATQDQTYKGLTNIETTEPFRCPTLVSPVRMPALTQQLTTGFQLSQEAWNKLNS